MTIANANKQNTTRANMIIIIIESDALSQTFIRETDCLSESYQACSSVLCHLFWFYIVKLSKMTEFQGFLRQLLNDSVTNRHR